MNEIEKLRAALKWALKTGAYVVEFDCGFRDHGCGCCDGPNEPPAEFDAIVREIRREIINERKS